MTAIRGYVRLGGLPDNPRTDPQDRAWFGPHDRLFIEEESEPIGFVPGPEHGKSPLTLYLLPPLAIFVTNAIRIFPYLEKYACGLSWVIDPTMAAGSD